MGGYTKEERAHIRKYVYAFKVSNSVGEFLIFYWHGFLRMQFVTGSDLARLYHRVVDSDFVEQYYECKKYASENNFLFEEYGKNDWKNILDTIHKVL